MTCKEVGMVEQRYYRWYRNYGGMKVDQAIKYIAFYFIDEIILRISEGIEFFKYIIKEKGLHYVVADQIEVISRFIKCG